LRIISSGSGGLTFLLALRWCFSRNEVMPQLPVLRKEGVGGVRLQTNLPSRIQLRPGKEKNKWGPERRVFSIQTLPSRSGSSGSPPRPRVGCEGGGRCPGPRSGGRSLGLRDAAGAGAFAPKLPKTVEPSKPESRKPLHKRKRFRKKTRVAHPMVCVVSRKQPRIGFLFFFVFGNDTWYNGRGLLISTRSAKRTVGLTV